MTATLPVLALALALAAGSAMAADLPSPPPRSFCAPDTAGIEPLAARPSRSVKEFGATGDGRTDDTRALQAALNGVTPGTVLRLPAGTYLYSDTLTLSRGDVVLVGEQAVLRATNPARQAVVVAGDRSAVVGLVVEGAGRRRLTTTESAQVVVTGRWVQVVGNTVSGGASAGIFVDGGRDFRISGNHVFATLADGIHMTNGARHGLVEGNVVHGTGDDLIAVVSYRPQRPDGEASLSGNILIANNRVWGNDWGRGITVVGGHDVAILGNDIRQVALAAGIYLAQESAWRTYGDRNITVAGNFIGDIQTGRLAKGKGRSGHGAIDVNTSDEAPMEYIDIEDNVVDGSGYAGIRLLGRVCPIRLAGNRLNRIGGNGPAKPIDVIHDLIHGGCPPVALHCRDNTADGRMAADSWPCGQSGAVDWRRPRETALAPHGTTWAACVQP